MFMDGLSMNSMAGERVARHREELFTQQGPGTVHA